MTVLSVIILILFCLGGLVMAGLGFPGVFAIAAGYLLFGFMRGAVDWKLEAFLIAAAILNEIMEWVVSALGAKKYGTSNAGIVGALVGGLIGAVVGVPIFLIGSVIGLLIGAYVGALLVEYATHRDVDRAFKAALGALMARGAAIALKVLVALVCVIAIAVRVLRF